MQTIADPGSTDPNAFNDAYGFAVALSGDGGTLVVGAYGTNSSRGVVYIYTKTGGQYRSPTVLTDPGGAASDSFGLAVAVSGDGGTVVVGAPNGNSTAGAAYLYNRSNGYSTHTTLTARRGRSQRRLRLHGGDQQRRYTVVIGAFAVNNLKGAAYLYTKIGNSYGMPLAFFDPGNVSSVYGDNSASRWRSVAMAVRS